MLEERLGGGWFAKTVTTALIILGVIVAFYLGITIAIVPTILWVKERLSFLAGV